MTPLDLALAAGGLRDLASVAPEVDLVVLFGSTVAGRARRGSDVDVAVCCDAVGDLDRLHAILAPRLGAGRLDLTDLRRAGAILAFQVARHGRVLYERSPGAFREFRSLAARRYWDTAKLRRARKRAIHVALGKWGLA